MEQRRSPGSFQEMTGQLGTNSFPDCSGSRGRGREQELCQLRGGTCQLRGRAVSRAWTEHSAALVPTPSACLPSPWQSRAPLHHAVAGQPGASALLHRSGESNQSEHPRPGLAFQTSGAAGSVRRTLGWAVMPRSYKKGPRHFSYWATSEKTAAVSGMGIVK